MEGPWCTPFFHYRGTRYNRAVLTHTEDLAKLTILDENGVPIEVGTLWRDKTAVLVFVRHFG